MAFDSIANSVAQQFVTAWHAPVPFLAALLLGWWVMSLYFRSRYQERLDTKDELIKLKEERLQDYKEKLSGATPEEARARLDALEARLDVLGPRHVTPEQRLAMNPVLDAGRGSKLEIGADASSPDAARYARELAEIFNASGWQTSIATLLGISRSPASGLALSFPNPSQPTVAQRSIISAFGLANIPFEVQAGNPREGADAHLLISNPHR